MTCNPSGVANTAMTSLLAGEDLAFTPPDLGTVTFPTVPALPTLIPPTQITIDQLTDRTIGGQGTFDAIMDALSKHLREEYDKGRIQGDQYAKAYIGLMEAALAQGVQVLMNKDTAYWQAVQVQQQAYLAQSQLAISRVQFETAKAELVLAAFKAKLSRAEYASSKMSLATAQVQYCTADFNLTNILPLQQLQLTAQTSLISSQKLQVDKEVQKSTAEIALIEANTDNAEAQTVVIQNQATLVKEQAEAQRAQTLDTRTDSLPVMGAIGKQKDLQAQQITSYQQDAAVKAAKFWLDGFTVQKSMDESLVPPTQFSQTNIDAVLTKLKTSAQLT